MKNWNEIRTAYQVACSGTVSGAAEVLGIHRATVLRHVDALEAVIGQKLFQRHAKGYTPTEVGLELLQIAQASDEQFSHFVRRIQGKTDELEGEFIITAMALTAPLLMPAIAAFRQQHPKINVKFMASEKLFKLEYGEAHVAVRAGPRPNLPDNVVQPLFDFRVGLYAHKDYIARKGAPASVDEFHEHDFVTSGNPEVRVNFHRWLRSKIPEGNIVFSSEDQMVLAQAILSGLGIGFLLEIKAQEHASLIQIMPPEEAWHVYFWLVTHGDMHRSVKVQAFLRLLKGDGYKPFSLLF